MGEPGEILKPLSDLRFSLDLYPDRSAIAAHQPLIQTGLGICGTRVPVKALFENLESGARIDDFLSWFPGVSREMAEAVLAEDSGSVLDS